MKQSQNKLVEVLQQKCCAGCTGTGKRTKPAGAQGEGKKETDATRIRTCLLKLNANCRLLGRERRKCMCGLEQHDHKQEARKNRVHQGNLQEAEERGVAGQADHSRACCCTLRPLRAMGSFTRGKPRRMLVWRDHPDNILKNRLYYGKEEAAASKKSPP